MKRKNIPPLRIKFIQACKQRRLAPRSQKAYAGWIKQFFKFCHPKKPSDLGQLEIASFLTYLVSKRRVSASTQNQAFNAIIFLFRYVLEKEVVKLPQIPRGLIRVRRKHSITRTEFQVLSSKIPQNFRVPFFVMYGCGLRISEAVNLKMKDILWDEGLLVLRNTKSRNERAVRIPKILLDSLEQHEKRRRNWQIQMERKRHPSLSQASLEILLNRYWSEEYLFVGNFAKYDANSETLRLKPISTSYLQRIFKTARDAAGINKPVSPHSLRYSFATEAIATGNNIMELQVTLGHKDPNTTAGYIDVMQTVKQVASPLDTLYHSLEQEADDSFKKAAESPRFLVKFHYNMKVVCYKIEKSIRFFIQDAWLRWLKRS